MRIQILELPSHSVGENMFTPCVLVIDQVADGELTQKAGDDIAERVGAEAAIVVAGTLDVLNPFVIRG